MSAQYSIHERDTDMVIDDDPDAGEVRMYPLQHGSYRRSWFACPFHDRREFCVMLFKFTVLFLLIFSGLMVGFYSSKKPVCYLGEYASDFDQSILDQSSNLIDGNRIREAVEKMSTKAHLSGSSENKQVYDWIAETVNGLSNFTHRTISYGVLLQKPKVEYDRDGTPISANVVEVLDSTNKIVMTCNDCGPQANGVVPFTAYSGPGEVTGEPVFINYGRDEDFKRLEDLKIDCSSRVLIAKLGSEPRGLIAWRVNQFCQPKTNVTSRCALLVYPDPADYPLAAPDETSSGLNRYLEAFGDLRTPFIPSIPNVHRETVRDSLLEQPNDVLIQPISQRFASAIMKNMAGPQITEWKGNMDVPYSVGPGYNSPDSTWAGYQVHVKLTNTWQSKDENGVTIQNLISVVPGSVERDRYVVIGAHYDALTCGARDNAGSVAVLLEVMRALHDLYKAGTWKPRRTIIFAFWDGEEFGQIGSTEFVEDFRVELGDRAVAYVNLDGVVSGTGFFMANEHPLFFHLLLNVTNSVEWPSSPGTKIAQRWVLDSSVVLNTQLKDNTGLWPKYSSDQQRLLAFIDEQTVDADIISWWTELGVPYIAPRFVNRSFKGRMIKTSTSPFFGSFIQSIRASGSVPHSSADRATELAKIDPGYKYHIAIARVILGLTHRLSDSLLLPANPAPFAAFVNFRLQEVLQKVNSSMSKIHTLFPWCNLPALHGTIIKAAESFFQTSLLFTARAAGYDYRKSDVLKMRRINDQLMLVDHAFDMMFNYEYRETKSTLFAPDKFYQEQQILFPGVRRAADELNAANNQRDQFSAATQLGRELSALLVGLQEATRLLRDEDDFVAV